MMPGGGRKQTDPRPVGNKAYTTESIMKLIIYLTEHGYDRAINKKILEAPTNKDFLSIVSFLLRAIDPNFEFKGKFEDELPNVLRLLGYPATVSKSALSAVSVPHRWPQLLAVLTWLVDLAKYIEAVTEAEARPDFDCDEGNKMFLEYLTQGYKLWLSGQDDLSASDQQMEFFFDAKNKSLNRDVEALQAANTEQVSQLEELTTGETPLQAAQTWNENLRSDTAKFEKHAAKLEEYCDKMTERVASAETSLTTRHKELDMLKTEIEMCKGTIASQEVSPVEVQRMGEERKRLEAELAQLKESKEALNKQKWDAEVAHKAQLDRLEAQVQQANKSEMRLKSAFPDGRKGESSVLQLQPQLLTSGSGSILSVDVSSVLKPEMLRIKASIAEKMAAAQDELLQAEEQETASEEARVERLEELQRRTAELGRLDKEEALEREQHRRDLEACTHETETIREQIVSARSKAGSSLRESQQQLAALHKEYDELVHESEKARKKLFDQVSAVVDTLLTHKDQLARQLNDLLHHADASAKKLEHYLPALASANATKAADEREGG